VSRIGAVRLTAHERRDEVVRAATKEFAARGYAGTSTVAIARRSKVSQPYLFQLFRTKKDLFVAAVRSCFASTRLAFEETGGSARSHRRDPKYVLEEMGHRYVELLKNRDMLRLQLQAYAACEDPEIRAVVRDEFAKLYQTVERVSGADEIALHAWFAEGMLLNVAASIGNLSSKDPLSMAALLRSGGAD
jgi:AcrR family transcriptional regulator